MSIDTSKISSKIKQIDNGSSWNAKHPSNGSKRKIVEKEFKNTIYKKQTPLCV